MKLARFGDDRTGIIRDDVIVDVTDVAGATPGEWPPVAMTRLIANYDELSAPKVQDRLDGLTPAELRKLRDYEQRHANRKTVLDRIERRLR